MAKGIGGDPRGNMQNELVKSNLSIRTRTCAVFVALLLFAPAPARAAVTVYELFTARGCPSCPAADALFGQIARGQPDVIALSCHVTYFDRPGRSDQMSAPFCDGRQEGYKGSKILKKIYTPAVVVNGARAVKGNDAQSVNDGLSTGRAESVPSVHLTERGGYLNIILPGLALPEPADVWLFAYDRNNSVTNLTKLMQWNGKAAAMAFPVQSIPANGYAVIAQTGNQTQIYAAGKTK